MLHVEGGEIVRFFRVEAWGHVEGGERPFFVWRRGACRESGEIPFFVW